MRLTTEETSTIRRVVGEEAGSDAVVRFGRLQDSLADKRLPVLFSC
ncbi:MAG: hypothetical protein Q8L56_05440 [Rhodocyclaceae bacterium]|nr:hypothetical protein [Rhodocyclaceae bacterium]MDP1957473.1 hypothetical protein [Rhodocyclaceae bacterium]